MKISDTVFFISDNQIYRGKIVDMDATKTNLKVLVKIKYEDHYAHRNNYLKIENCFASVDQLLKSLSNNIQGI